MTTTRGNETFTEKREVVVISLEVCVLWGVLYWNIPIQINILNKKGKDKEDGKCVPFNPY